MTYSESAIGIKITRNRAYKEVLAHGLADEWADCLDCLLPLGGTEIDEDGNITAMLASDVLEWLGY